MSSPFHGEYNSLYRSVLKAAHINSLTFIGCSQLASKEGGKKYSGLPSEEKKNMF
jgi:hypothetical protein